MTNSVMARFEKKTRSLLTSESSAHQTPANLPSLTSWFDPFKVFIFNRKAAYFGCVIVFLQCAQVGTKVAAASRKTNTTTHEVLGVLTKGDTQVVSFLLLTLRIYTYYLVIILILM